MDCMFARIASAMISRIGRLQLFTMTTPEGIIESFPNPDVPKIEGLPTYESIANLRTLLSANAASVQSGRGGGTNGYLGIVLSDAVYATVSATPCFIKGDKGINEKNIEFV